MYLNHFQGVLKQAAIKHVRWDPPSEVSIPSIVDGLFHDGERDCEYDLLGNCHYQFAPHPESQLFAKFLALNMQTGIWRKLQKRDWFQEVFGAISNFL